MKIWLDDIRDAPDETWTVARTAEEAMELLVQHQGQVTEMSFDHDLGEDVSTGYDVLVELEYDAHCALNKQMLNVFVPPVLHIHSANPVGRKNMQAAIDSIERMRNAL